MLPDEWTDAIMWPAKRRKNPEEKRPMVASALASLGIASTVLEDLYSAFDGSIPSSAWEGMMLANVSAEGDDLRTSHKRYVADLAPRAGNRFICLSENHLANQGMFLLDVETGRVIHTWPRTHGWLALDSVGEVPGGQEVRAWPDIHAFLSDFFADAEDESYFPPR